MIKDMSTSFRPRKYKKHIPEIAKLSIEELEKQTREDNKELFDQIDKEVKEAITAEFIKHQHIDPPAIHGIKETRSEIGVGIPNKIELLLRNPYQNRPKSIRSRHKDNDKRKSIIAPAHVRKEIEKESLRQQEKAINDSLIKPLTNKGIKVNNFRTVYPK